MTFSFLSFCEKTRDNKEFSYEYSNLAVNHESRPFKSNAVLWEFFHPDSIQDMSLCDIMLNVYCAISNIKITNFSLYFVPNSMLFIFSFLKWILSLLSINQSQIFEKNCLGFYWLYRYCCVDTRNKSRLHGLIRVLSVTTPDFFVAIVFMCFFVFVFEWLVWVFLP